MASASHKILAIYRALRLEFGQNVASGELLAAASAIFDEYQRVKKSDDRLDGGRYRPTIPSMPADQAFDDGGWRVLEFDRRERFELDDCSFNERMYIQQKLREILEQS